MKKTIGVLLLCSWIPTLFGMAFDVEEWYTISGLMLFVFGTWAGILLVREE